LTDATSFEVELHSSDVQWHIVVVACVFAVMVVHRHLLTIALTSASGRTPLLHSSTSESCLIFVLMTTWYVICLYHIFS